MGKFLSITLLTAGFFYLYNKFLAFYKVQQKKALLDKMQRKKQEDYLNRLKEYNVVNNYSICLSLDYKSQRKIAQESKSIITKVIFAKITKMLNIVMPDLEIKTSPDALVVLSDNFEIYDSIYDTILKILAKVKTQVDDRYSVYMIPSITTDAYTLRPNVASIKKNHANIKHCNFINKATTSKAFSKKYEYLNKNKYMGVPLGEYSIIDDEKTNTYELNMVYKNLSDKLESMGR